VKDFCFYIVAKNKRFIDAAIRSANSFLYFNPDIAFKIFILGKNNSTEKILFKDIEIINISDYHININIPSNKQSFFDICFFQLAEAPKYINNSKYICFLGADTLCLQKLPFKYLINPLEEKKICVTPDAKSGIRKQELYDIIDISLYFNDGSMFWNIQDNKIFYEEFKRYIINNIEELSKLPFYDQTWMNIFMNTFYKEKLYEIGYFWNFRGSVKNDKAFIWHAGGRNSDGIEQIKKVYDNSIRKKLS